MNRLVRAKQFLLGRLRSSQLKVAVLGLLAAAAMPANTITDVTVIGPAFTSGSGSLNSTTISNASGTGLRFFGSADPACSQSDCALQFDFAATNNLAGGTQVLFSWAFSISSFQGSSGSVNWSLTNGANVTFASGTATSFLDAFSGSLLIPEGTVRFSATGSPFSLSIPANSLDFAPPPNGTAIPEPSTIALTLAGGLVLEAVRRLKK